jgi:hypothetical protein
MMMKGKEKSIACIALSVIFLALMAVRLCTWKAKVVY